jgi:hypothetical protein
MPARPDTLSEQVPSVAKCLPGRVSQQARYRQARYWQDGALGLGGAFPEADHFGAADE